MTLLASVAELADHLKTPIDLDDASAYQALEGASDACIQYANGHSFFPVSSEEAVFRGDGSEYVILKKPLVEVTSVTLDGKDLVEETDYYLTPAGNLRRPYPWVWTAGKRIEVTYSYGDEEIPASVRLACLLEAAERFQLAGRPGDLQSETIDDYSYTRANGNGSSRLLTSDAKTLLEPFRVISVA